MFLVILLGPINKSIVKGRTVKELANMNIIPDCKLWRTFAQILTLLELIILQIYYVWIF
jgi:hypothetical protein